MSLDPVKNFAWSTVATAPSPATTGLTLVLATGGGALMPTVPFDAIAAPAGANPTAATAEIITVTAVATDTLTFTRQSQSSTLQAIATSWTIDTGVTAKTVTDLGKSNYTYVVAATGGDYTTLSAALASAPANSTYFVRGTITETAAIVCSAANISVIGSTQSVVNLVNQAATCWTMSGANWVIQGITIIGGTTDKGADGTGQMTLSGNYGKISNCLLKEGASTTTTYGSFMVIDGQWCEVSSNQFQSMNVGGAMVFRFNPYNRNITVRNNEIFNTSGKAFFALDPTGQTSIDIKGVQIIGNNGMMTTGSARYRAIDVNFYAATTCYLIGSIIADNQINVVANEFIGVNGGNYTDNSCIITGNMGQGVQTGTGYAISVFQCNNSIIANNRCTDMTVYFCTNSTITGNESKTGSFSTNGNQLGLNSTLTANTFPNFTVGRATSCVINGNVGVNFVTVNGTTNCQVYGNSSSAGAFSVSGDNSSTVHGNICLGGNLTIAGTGTVEYGNSTGNSGFVVSTTITTPRAFGMNSPLTLKNSETHNWQSKAVSYTMVAGDFGIIATAAITVTLPSATVVGIGYQAEIAPNSFAVTVAATAGTVATTALSGQVAGKYVSDGTNWISR